MASQRLLHTASELTANHKNGHALHPGPCPPDLSRHFLQGFNHWFTHVTHPGLASRTRPVWQYQHVSRIGGAASHPSWRSPSQAPSFDLTATTANGEDSRA